jgi:hypothetical protein
VRRGEKKVEKKAAWKSELRQRNSGSELRQRKSELRQRKSELKQRKTEPTLQKNESGD